MIFFGRIHFQKQTPNQRLRYLKDKIKDMVFKSTLLNCVNNKYVIYDIVRFDLDKFGCVSSTNNILSEYVNHWITVYERRYVNDRA